MKRLLAGLIGALLLATPAFAGFTVPPNRPGAYAPRDECQSVPGASAFAAGMRSAIARRDAQALAGLAADDVQLDFGGGAGKAELRKRLTGPDAGALWRDLEQASALGCAIQEGDMVFPWFFAQNLGDVDPFDALLVTGRAVPLYRRNTARARPIAWLNWQLVIAQGTGLAEGAETRPLRQVSVITSPLEGFVPSGQLRSPLAYRIIAARKGRAWKISTIIAGD
jgi:hypothetical protein